MLPRVRVIGWQCPSTLFDIAAFLSDLVEDGLEAAVEQRTRNFQAWCGDAPIKSADSSWPWSSTCRKELKDQLPAARNFRVFRYELAISEDDEGVLIDSERGILMPEPKPDVRRWSPVPGPYPARLSCEP